MNRKHAAVISLFLAFALLLGMFSALRTTHLGAAATTPTARQLAAKSRLLDGYQAQLHRAAAQRPPALPALPALPAARTTLAAAPAAQRVVYVRPAPVVRVLHRHGGDEGFDRGRDSERGADGSGGGLDD